MVGSARRWKRRSWWRVVVPVVGSIAALVLGASPAVAVPTDPGGGDPPPDCAAGTTGSLTVSPGTVMAGGSVTVSWSVQQVAGCPTLKWINGVGFTGASVGLSGSRAVTVTTVGTASWSLQASASGGPTHTLDTASVSVQAPPPPLVANSTLAAAVDGFGRMQTIMARSDDVVLRDAQISPGQRFGGWSTVPDQRLRSVAAEADGSGRVVQVGFDGAGHIWGDVQTFDGTGWVGWTAIDGTVNSIALARNGNGRLEMFATNTAGTVFHRSQNLTGTVSFGQWFTLPGQLSQIAAETNAAGRIEVVGIDSAHQVWHQTQTDQNSGTWTGWAQIPGALDYIAIARNSTGALEIFGTSSGALRVAVQKVPNGPDWNNFFIARDGRGPVAAQSNVDSDGRVAVFAQDAAGAMSYLTIVVASGAVSISAWQPLIQYRVGLGPGTKHKLIVVSVNWTAGNGTPAAPPTKPASEVAAMIDNDWWAEVSYGQFPGWDVTSYGSVTISAPRVDLPSGFCGDDFLDDVSDQVDPKVSQSGFDLSQYMVLYWFTYIGSNCGWNGGYRHNGRIYINGGREEDVNHELGHSVGLSHASAWNCVGNVGNRVTWSNSCTRDEYGDPNDAMDNGVGGGYNAMERNRLGWMSGRVTDVPIDGGSYTLAPLELTTPGPQALRLTDGPTFWIEYREAIGVDTGHLPVPGVLIYAPYGDGASGILDLTPSTSGFSDASLLSGLTWISPTGDYKVKVDSVSSVGAHITISLNRATVPTVVGTDAATAESTLVAAGFAYAIHEVVDSTCTRINQVTGQSPAGQAQAIPGSTVTIDVNVAPDPPAECA